MPPLLSPTLTDRVLRHLQFEPAPPSRAALDMLLLRYGQKVPWESASRMARAARTPDYVDAPRWSEEFWESALAYGTGGTCFESNYAFSSLLATLGYDVYLTINNMGNTQACHTATIVQIDGGKWLADAGYPLYAALPLDPEQPTECTTPYITFHAEPKAANHYLITNTPHPEPYMFDLIDQPVDDTTYRAATTNDYGPGGFFLRRVILRKAIGDALWRFDSNEPDPVLQRFANAQRSDTPIIGELAPALSKHFGMAEAVIAAALAALHDQRASTM
jgi:arylamine N-acetyltransferase